MLLPKGISHKTYGAFSSFSKLSRIVRKKSPRKFPESSRMEANPTRNSARFLSRKKTKARKLVLRNTVNFARNTVVLTRLTILGTVRSMRKMGPKRKVSRTTENLVPKTRGTLNSRRSLRNLRKLWRNSINPPVSPRKMILSMIPTAPEALGRVVLGM